MSINTLRAIEIFDCFCQVTAMLWEASKIKSILVSGGWYFGGFICACISCKAHNIHNPVKKVMNRRLPIGKTIILLKKGYVIPTFQ
jgi:hypothetical protein